MNILKFIKSNLLIILYSIIELILGIILIFNNKINGDNLRYTFILINFVLSIILLIIYKNKSSLIITIALFFTCLADYGLIILGKNKELSVLFFTYTQISYMFYIGFKKKELIFRLIVIIILELISYFIVLEYYSLLVFITMIYFSTFICNIFYSIKKKKNIVFILGLILFILCDLCVGISGFEYFGDSNFINLCGKLIFYFYLPSQYLIVLNLYIQNLKKF